MDGSAKVLYCTRYPPWVAGVHPRPRSQVQIPKEINLTDGCRNRPLLLLLLWLVVDDDQRQFSNEFLHTPARIMIRSSRLG